MFYRSVDEVFLLIYLHTVMSDVTQLFKQCIKDVKAKNKHLSSVQSNSQNLLKRRRYSHFFHKARDVVSLIYV